MSAAITRVLESFSDQHLWTFLASCLCWQGQPKAVAVHSSASHAEPSAFPMSEPPIVTTGVICEVLPDRVFRVELPNGKLVIGHLPGRLAGLAEELALRNRVHLELTPYDFEKARIVGPVNHSDE